jgi:hypothetical protein
MQIEHAQPEAFHKWIQGEASQDEMKAIVRHLLAGCGRCLKRSERAQEETEDQDSWSYDGVFARLESRLFGEREESPGRSAYAAARA